MGAISHSDCLKKTLHVKIFPSKLERIHEEKGRGFDGLRAAFFLFEFFLSAYFNASRSGKQSSGAGKVLNAAYTEGDFLPLL